MSDDDTLGMYLAGYYLYSVYSDSLDTIDNNNNHNINPCDAFYLVLGWVIKEFYPDCFSYLCHNII